MSNRNAITILVVFVLVVLGVLYFANRYDDNGTVGTSTSQGGNIFNSNGSNNNNNGAATSTGGLGGGTSTTTPGQGTLLGSAASLSARAVLASRLNTTIGNVTVTDVEEATWPNGCLGLARTGEVCTQALTEGYRVTMTSGSQTYVYRTNRTGTMVRAEK